DAAGLSPRNVALEVLESVLVENDEDPAIRTVAALAAAGFSVELDDFGTGHASIANLQKMQVHRIKIDRGFVTGLDRRAESRKIVGGIVGLASSLSIQTLAEGVETAAEAAAARDLGCELAQGFFIGRPMPREAAERWIRAWTPAAFVAELNRAATAASARPEDEAEAEATSGALAAAQPSEPPGPSARRRHG
ncbi:MAG: EAL domain-containing protein, partial [Pseudomonadota bacterium]|nr:EAL domain-containing protein [Pseudomonadota bacterium]